MNRYSYQELRAAVEADASEANVNTLGEWFEAYGNIYWNGEYYDADGLRLFPVYSGYEDQASIVGWEAR